MGISKRDSLLSKLGSGLSDSIGIRDGEDTLPSYQTSGGRPPRTNFVRSRDTGDIELDEVMPDPDQPRKEFDEEEIERLAKSIKDHGLIQPIRVRWSEQHDKWLIIAGERRWRAHKLAGFDRIRCTFVDQEQAETLIRSQQIIENVLREDLTGMELARALKNLQDDNGWSATQVADELNISKGKVSKALALLKLPEDLQSQVESGSISPATAYELSKVKDQGKQKEMAEQAVAGHIRCTDAAKSTSGKRKPRKTTNETFRTSDGVRLVISSRRDIGEQGMIDALLEVADLVRQRKNKAA
ncbi:ParB/RepB/Spo0J family partition protein [Botrimarina mediterranea]|uniref:ParB/RepB/Spo0J family partition protein n=1 Tax=Botrimarina mediterranea TaxID=2528022 RepID=UPI001188CE2A|nr:putative chromosome-partitioning protein ParB [Planctomycetes bacterium K2D]